MVPTQILVHRRGPKTKISALFRRRTEPEFSFVCGAGYIKIGTMGKEGGGGGGGEEQLYLGNEFPTVLVVCTRKFISVIR